MANCENCGAPVSNGKCAYCGTEYGELEKIPDNYIGTFLNRNILLYYRFEDVPYNSNDGDIVGIDKDIYMRKDGKWRHIMSIFDLLCNPKLKVFTSYDAYHFAQRVYVSDNMSLIKPKV